MFEFISKWLINRTQLYLFEISYKTNARVDQECGKVILQWLKYPPHICL